jgi:pimeloyl-ACP methyl ester carboxylesterase
MIFLPKGFDRSKPTPVIVNLYFLDHRPDQFCGRPAQELANSVGVPIICVSDARPIERYPGPWGEDPAAAAKRIEAVLGEVADRVTVVPEGVIALGFSTGAILALELACRHPERYAGAIAISPFGVAPLDTVETEPKLRGRRFLLATDADPSDLDTRNIQECREQLDRAGVDVRHEKMDDQFGRKFTPAFDRKLAGWVAFVLSKK